MGVFFPTLSEALQAARDHAQHHGFSVVFRHRERELYGVFPGNAVPPDLEECVPIVDVTWIPSPRAAEGETVWSTLERHVATLKRRLLKELQTSGSPGHAPWDRARANLLRRELQNLVALLDQTPIGTIRNGKELSAP